VADEAIMYELAESVELETPHESPEQAVEDGDP